MKGRVGLALVVALVAVAAGSPVASSQEEHALLLIAPVPAGAEERIAGQISDLPWRLSKAEGLAKTVAAAHAAALARGARAALWLEADDEGIVLRLYDPRRRRLLERRFEAGTGALARSAALEAMALSARSALRAIGADEVMGEEVGGAAGTGTGAGAGADGGTGTGTGRSTGTGLDPDSDPDPDTDPDQDPDSNSDPDPEPEPEPDTDPDSDADSVSSSVPLALTLAAGWNSAIDGQTSTGQQGPFARVGVALARLEFAVQLQTALAADIERSGVALGLTRKLALASVAIDLHRGSRARIALGAVGGIAHFHRATRSLASGLRGDPADADGERDTLSAAFGLELRASLLLLDGAHSRFEIELTAGALCVPAAPVLRYDLPTGRQDRALWLFEPFVQLGPRLQLGP